jgi:uncharacterized hydrophobic protein (TIGR00271 family)
MLHVRVVCPPLSAGSLVESLAADPGVRNLVVLPGAARRPAGDAVQFDLRTAAANPVLRELRERCATDGGTVAIENVAATITAPTDKPDDVRTLDSEAAPIWELVDARIRSGGVYPPSFYILLVVAGLIGAVGILTNSQILIVGAMVVGPEYGAIMATALGFDKKEARPVLAGLSALTLGFAAASFATLVFGLIIRWSGHTPAPYEAGVRPVADFINSPNLFSVVVAVLAGVVGVVSLTQARANALIGVFISVTTIPAAAGMGLSAAYGDWPAVGGSAVQLLVNVVVLIAVGAAGLGLQRFIWQAREARSPVTSVAGERHLRESRYGKAHRRAAGPRERNRL